MNKLPVDIGTLGRWGRLTLRPTLQLTYAGPRITEQVSVWYPYRDSVGYFGTATTASVSVPAKTQGTAKYVRAWVHNLFGISARHCQVFVDRVWQNDKLVEPERTRLHWADKDDCFELPFMRMGRQNGHYIDICATDSVL